MASASSPRPFPPNQTCLGQGEAQQLTVIPTVTQGWASSSSTTPIPFPHPLGLPASRLQDSGLLKTEKLTSQHVYNFDFANTTLLPSPPPCIHSFLISHFLVPSYLLSCIWASHGPWSFGPKLQFSWSSSQKPTYLWPVVLGFLLGYLPLLHWNQ